MYRWGARAALLLGLLVGMGRGMAAAQTTAPVTVAVNGEIREFSPPPAVEDGRVLVPIRETLEAAGASVEWDEEDRTATVTREGHRAVLVMDHHTISSDGRPVVLDVAPRIIDGAAYVPLRAIAEALGAQVQWSAGRRMVVVAAPQLPRRVARAEPETMLDATVDAEVKDRFASVVLDDQGITLIPATVAAGEVEIRVVNTGLETHALAIGRTKARTPDLGPGESAALIVTLRRGTYSLYCPVADHRALGAEATLGVQ